MNHLLKPYLTSVGIWQAWNMFAPNPISINFALDAEIEYKDGSTKTWELPQVSKFGSFEKPFKNRAYKKSIDWTPQNRNSPAWPYLAKYLVHELWNDDNPPIRVRLQRHWTKIPAPTPQFYQPFLNGSTASNSYFYYSYLVPK